MQSVRCCEIHRKEPEGIRVMCPSLIKRPKTMQKGQNIRLKVDQKAPSCLPSFSRRKKPTELVKQSKGSQNTAGAVVNRLQSTYCKGCVNKITGIGEERKGKKAEKFFKRVY